jgi:CheY-like chemotaxis protein
MDIEKWGFLNTYTLNFINSSYEKNYEIVSKRANKKINNLVGMVEVFFSLLILTWVLILCFQTQSINYKNGIIVSKIDGKEILNNHSLYYNSYKVTNLEGVMIKGNFIENVRKTLFLERCLVFSVISSFSQILTTYISKHSNNYYLQKILFCLLFSFLGFNFHIFSGILQSFYKLDPGPIFVVVASQVFFRMVVVINSKINWYYIFYTCLISLCFEWTFFYLIHYRSHSVLSFYLLVNTLVYLASTVLAYYTDNKSKKEYYLLQRINFDRDYLMNFLYYMSQGYFTMNESDLLFVNKSMDKVIKIFLTKLNRDYPIMMKLDEDIESDNTFLTDNKYSSNVKMHTKENIENIIENLSEINENLPKEILAVFERTNGAESNIKKGSFSLSKFSKAVRSSNVYQTYVENSKFEHLGIITLQTMEDNLERKRKFSVMFRLMQHGDSKDYLEFLFSDVTQIVHDERERAVTSCRSIYLSKIAHEFKNPLSSQIELACSINDDIKPIVSEISNKIIKKTDHSIAICHNMNYLLKDFSILTSLKSPCKCGNLINCTLCNKYTYCKKCLSCWNCHDVPTDYFDVSPILINFLSGFTRLSEFENKEIYLDFEVKSVLINTKKSYLESILFNIISHCYKRGSKGIISLYLIENKDNLTFKLIDSGPKLDLKYINELMENERIEDGGRYSDTFFEKFNKHFHIYVVISLIRRIGSYLNIESSQSKSIYSFSVDSHPRMSNVKKTATNVSMLASELEENSSCNTPETVRKDTTMKFFYDEFDLNQSLAPSDSANCLSNNGSKSFPNSLSEENLKQSSFKLEEFSKELEEPHFNHFNNSNSIFNKRILIIDDESLVRSGLRRYFLKIGKIDKIEIYCDEAEDCFVAMDMIYKNNLKNIHYDLVIIDECMPHMRGSTMIKIMKTLNEEGNLYKIPFISHTAYDTPEKRKLILESGADLIISKPSEFGVFKEHVENIFLNRI